MEINTSQNDSSSADLPNINDRTYHDDVKTFDLLYEITDSSEKKAPIIHYHECFEVVFYISADLEVYLDDAHCTLGTGQILLIPPRKIHKLIYSENTNYIRYIFYFTLDHVANAFHGTAKQKVVHFFQSPDSYKAVLSAPEFFRMKGIFHNMLEHKQTHSAKNHDLLTTYASVILQELYLIFSSQTPEEKSPEEISPVEQILVYINDHYSQQITLQDLEENFFLNKSYICRIFRKTMGISLVNYLQYKRILEAQKLLLNSDMPIIEIGMECGFTSVQHFYRVFKKITGLTPKEYKKNQLHTSLGQSISLLPRNPGLADGVQISDKKI